ncbi:MAG: flagellar hook-associated protein FlgK [Phycisphaerales bacterium]
MGLTSSFWIGASALNASQVALQVTGNNLANAATPGYTRQIARMSPQRSQQLSPRTSVGQGVRVAEVRRQIDEALQARLWGGISTEAQAAQQLGVLSQLESTLNELSGQDLSTELREFFNVWSERANLSESSAVVVQQGERLANFVQRLRADLVDQRGQVDRQLGSQVDRAGALLDEIAGLNVEIARVEGGGGGTANALRDRRDTLVTELSGFIDVNTVERDTGTIDVLVGSIPVVLGNMARGLTLRSETVDGETRVAVAVRDDGSELNVQGGTIGGLLAARGGGVDASIAELDGIASQLIFEVNRVHSTGTNATGLKTTTGSLGFSAADRLLALNDPDNTATGSLPFRAVNGGFLVRVKQSATGAVEEVFVKVDLDGRDASGAPGFDDDATAEGVRAAIDAVDGVRASFTADGRLKVDAEAGFEFSFRDDTSGALAVLGVNSYFTGRDAGDIAVRGALASNPTLLLAGRIVNGTLVENANAMRIVAVADKTLSQLGGRSIGGAWSDHVQRVGASTQSALTRSDAATLVREGLDAQRAAVSGVSIDEESVNMIALQRQYQGAARFIGVIDELTQTLINLV